jgi:hypothetical protein
VRYVLCERTFDSKIYTFPEDCLSYSSNFRIKTDSGYFKNVTTVRDDSKCPKMEATNGFKICKKCPKAQLLYSNNPEEKTNVVNNEAACGM